MPERPHTAANAAAWDLVIRPEGSGLLAVLFINASNLTSRIWLMVLAQPLHNNVPSMAHPKSCRVLMSYACAGATEKPAPAVMTTKVESFNLESSQ